MECGGDERESEQLTLGNDRDEEETRCGCRGVACTSGWAKRVPCGLRCTEGCALLVPRAERRRAQLLPAAECMYFTVGRSTGAGGAGLEGWRASQWFVVRQRGECCCCGAMDA